VLQKKKAILYFLFSITIIGTLSCAKVRYLTTQGMGQWKLINSAKENSLVLKDNTVNQETKNKIEKIEKIKKFFFNFFNRDATPIYEKTAFLKGEAVTYLVIASPYDDVEAHEEWFPFFGNFPYLGFFEEEDAKHWARNLEKRDMVTYIRPVYAYSTLGHLDDPILSSFFRWDDWELTNVIFHELFHTIFFVKDEVDLNEALADFMAFELSKIYFKLPLEKLAELDKKMAKHRDLEKLIKDKAHELKEQYAKEKSSLSEGKKLDKQIAEQIFQKIYSQIKEKGRELCTEAKIGAEECLPLERPWNNAALAAFLTYEEESDFLREIFKREGQDIRQMLQNIEKKYQYFKKEKPRIEGEKISFLEFIHLDYGLPLIKDPSLKKDSE